jgi:RNA processing factor Prp31
MEYFTKNNEKLKKNKSKTRSKPKYKSKTKEEYVLPVKTTHHNVSHLQHTLKLNRPKKSRVNINIQNKNIKLLKRPIPKLILRQELGKIKKMFDDLIKVNKEFFNYEYEFNNANHDDLIILLNELIDNLIRRINVIESMIVNDVYLNNDTTIYNYYVSNFMNLRNEIYNMFSKIKISNSRVVRYQLKTFKNYISEYIENIIN